MKLAFILFVHLIVSLAKLIGPGGTQGLLAETIAVKHQLLIASRSRHRAPNLTPTDRALLGIGSLLIRPHRLPKVAVVVSIATFFKFHDALKKRKYRRLFSAHSKGKPGPKVLALTFSHRGSADLPHRDPMEKSPIMHTGGINRMSV